MKASKFSTALILAGVIALPAVADDIYYETAPVISVTPQYEQVNSPRQECRTDYERSSSYNSGNRDVGGAIIGGIAGGLLGSQVGKGNGKVAAAAIGAATGALVGDRIDNSSDSVSYRTRPIERCTTVDNWQTVTRNYLVVYRYNGRDYTSVLPYDPGSNIRLRVSVVPDGRASQVGYLEPGFPGHRGWDRRNDRDDWDDHHHGWRR